MYVPDEPSFHLPESFHAALEALDENDTERGIGLLHSAITECRGVIGEPLALCTALLAEAYLQAEQGDDALHAFRDAAGIYRECGMFGEAAACDLDIGRLHLRNDDLEPAAREFDRARAYITDPEDRADCLWMLGTLWYCFDRDAEAADILAEAVGLLERAGTDEQIAACQLDLAAALQEIGRYSEAEKTFRQAWQVFTEAQDGPAEYKCARSVADLHFARLHAGEGNAEQTRAAYRTARDVAFDAGLREGAADCLVSLAALDHDADSPEAALTSLAQARSEFADLGDHARVAQCELDAVDLHRRCGDTQAAVRSLESASAAFKVAGDEELSVALDVFRARTLGDLGKYDDADTLYLSARGYYVAHELRVELAECDTYRAGTLLDAGRAAEAETLLTTTRPVFEDLGSAFGMLMCDRFFGVLFRSRSDFDNAEAAFRSAITTAGSDPESAELVADCRAELGITFTLSGKYTTALRELEAADRYYREAGQILKRAGVLQTIGMGQYYTAAYANAAGSLRAARRIYDTHGYVYAGAIVDAHLAMVHLQLHQWKEAEAATLAARQACEEAGVGRQVAICDANLGCLYFGMKDYERAERYLRAAASSLVDESPEMAAQCHHNLAALYTLTGRYRDAEVEFTAAEAVYGNRPEFVWQNAVATTNRGMLALSAGQHPEALRMLGSARRMFANLDARPQVARCDFLIAATNLDESRAAGAPNFDRAFDRALPPVLFIDAQRFAFATARDRAGWSNTANVFLSMVFEWAREAGREALLSELVESAVNAGIHSAVSDGADAAPAFDVPSDITAMTAAMLEASVAESLQPLEGRTEAERPDTGRGPAAAINLSATGVAALINDPRLPLLPPPRLRMPGGRIALASHIDAAESVYGTVRREGVVAVG